MSDYGKWVGGVMQAHEGGNDPIARNTMAAQIVAHGKEQFGTDCDLIVLAVPAGSGDVFMQKWVEGVGENPAIRGTVDL